MSMLARAPLRQLAVRRFVAPTGRRSAHGGGHHEAYEHIPFDYSNKTTFAIKVSAYLATGFALPFVAAYYQISKSAGAA